MKILIISTMNGFRWGGSEELWFEVTKFAEKMNLETQVVLFPNLPLHPKIVSLVNRKLVFFVEESEIIHPPLWKKLLFKILSRKIPITNSNRFQFLEKLQYDLILLSQGSATDILHYADLYNNLIKSKKPLFILSHLFSSSVFIDEVGREKLRMLNNHSIHHFFVSKNNKKDFERRLALSINNSSIVKNPVNIDNLGFVDWPQGDCYNFAIVARLEVNHKGHDILLQVLSQEKWLNRNFKLNIYGEGPHESYINELITFFKLDEKVQMKGSSSNIRELWESNHLLILPSNTEGLPLTIIEAMLCGRPVLSTDVGDNSKVIIEGETGWIAASNSISLLDDALERAWSVKDFWKVYGENAIIHANEFIDPNPGLTLLNIMKNQVETIHY